MFGPSGPFGLVLAGPNIGVAGPAEEGEDHLAGHVEAGEQGGDQAHCPKCRVFVPGKGQDLVLGPEPGERGDAGDG